MSGIDTKPKPSDFFFIRNPINIGLLVIWVIFLIYTIILTTKEEAPVQDKDKQNENEKIQKDNEFSYVTTLFCIFTLLNYFRYFPFSWNDNTTMKVINWIAVFGSLISMFFIINKNKLNEKTTNYKTKLLPMLGMFITLAVYSIHTGFAGIMAHDYDSSAAATAIAAKANISL